MSIATRDDNESQPSINTSSTNYTSSVIYNAFPKPVPVQWSQPCRPFEYHEIVSATKNFDESLVIARRFHGNVYKGNLVIGSSSVNVAIKRFDSVFSEGEPGYFRADVETLSKVRHNNVVPLIGYCDYGKEMLFIYEYIPNGTLYEHLHTLGTRLCWQQRLKICIGVARALDYLHTRTGIIHGDVKSSSILLDTSWAPKISDFGSSKIVQLNDFVSTRVKGNYAYLDLSYYLTGNLTRKSDVYAFGVVLLEVLCRKKAVDQCLDKEKWGLAIWALDLIKEHRLKYVIDSDIRYEISPNCWMGYVRIAERCLDNDPENRPTMAEVVSTLESVLILQEKADTAFQTAWKRISGGLADTFSITTNDKNSGMGFGFRMPEKKKLLLLREKILQQNGMVSYNKLSKKILQLKPHLFGSIQLFGAKELEKATNSYDEDRILGKGAQGVVYKGILPDKRVVAVKILRVLGQSRLEQFITEIAILEQINHKNVVQLFGCCFITDGVVLVYELVSNGTLHHLIHNETSGAVRLSWDSRLRIAHESADALAYLHTYETISIIHRDVKSANILLDKIYTAKISDFGSSRLIPLNRGQVHAEVEGTFGYMDPEYYHTCQLTCKTDVYSFGVVLAELLTGKKPIDKKRHDDIRLSTYFVTETKKNRLREIVDPQVLEEATDEQLSATCDLAYRCLEQLGKNRPSMKEVTVELETIRKLGKHPSVSQASRLVQRLKLNHVDLHGVPLPY